LQLCLSRHQGMDVHVVEAWEDCGTVEVDYPCAVCTMVVYGCVIAYRDDDSVAHGEGVRPAVREADLAVAEDCIGWRGEGYRDREGGCGRRGCGRW
jgi:hypothetical protein